MDIGLTGADEADVGGEMLDNIGGGEVLTANDPVTELPSASRIIQQDDYNNRGPHFEHTNFLEFGALVQRVAKNKVSQPDGTFRLVMDTSASSDGTTRRRGRRPNFRAEFKESYAFHATKYMQLRSKSSTPILAGPPRPTEAQ